MLGKCEKGKGKQETKERTRMEDITNTFGRCTSKTTISGDIWLGSGGNEWTIEKGEFLHRSVRHGMAYSRRDGTNPYSTEKGPKVYL